MIVPAAMCVTHRGPRDGPSTLQIYGRTVANILLPNWMNLNQELVKQGWWYRKYAPWDTVLEGLEKDA